MQRQHDESNGYESVAEQFTLIRDRSVVGVTEVQQWARLFNRGSEILDLGCGSGVPVARALLDAQLNVYGVDASPTLIATFLKRFPSAEAECASVTESPFFNRQFDGVIAWGLMFLLAPPAQVELIHKVAQALKKGGRLVFTAPKQIHVWTDILTGRESHSLGEDEYRRVLQTSGLTVTHEVDDEGANHYYFAVKD